MTGHGLSLMRPTALWSGMQQRIKITGTGQRTQAIAQHFRLAGKCWIVEAQVDQASQRMLFKTRTPG